MNSRYRYVARSIIWLLAATALCAAEGKETTNYDRLVWTSPSKDSRGAMPIGNGEMGANVWVEPNGDLLFYLSRTDAWSENCRLLKLGRVRVTLTPNPLQEGGTFSQTLDCESGEILIRFKTPEQDVKIRFAVDAHHPVVTVDIDSEQLVEARVSLEHWRTQRRELKGAEAHSAYGLSPAGGETVAVDPIFVEPDRIMPAQKDRVIWYHRNERSVWKANLELQALGDVAENQEDPLLNRTFGALIQGKGLVSQSDTLLKSAKPANRVHVAVHMLTAQTKTADAWLTQLEDDARRISALSHKERRTAHRAWWKAFWERSHIRVSTQDDKDRNIVENINRGYILQRWINACGGRGRFPIKFNGSIFTVDTMNHTDRFKGHDADYRQWGGPYWWQNTRLPYWSMLESGDFDLMTPLFTMFRHNLESRKVATRKYYDHDGAFFPETQYFWGTYADGNYGRERSELPDGMTLNRFIRYYWQGGLELSLMMLDHYAFTGDDTFARETLVPLVSEILTFFDQHWQRDANGKIRFDPAMALETYREAVNPLVEIVGIQKVCEDMLALPEALTTESQRTQWKRLISELPPVPMREENGETLLACADTYSGKQNIENPELYAIFPYRRYGLGKPDLELARRTFAKRLIKQTGGWQQNAIKAAYLGLADEAAWMVGQNFSSKSSQHRFGAMWGPNYDWIPDQCHGSVAMTALQRMLLQYEGDTIRLLPAWPRHWDVDFKLHAPRKTTVEGRVRNGEIAEMKVSPASRRGDVKTEWSVATNEGDTYSNPDLPPLLECLDGTPVRTLEDWQGRRQEIHRLMTDMFMGTFPEKTPKLLEAQTVSETRQADGSLRRRVRLTFDTPTRVAFEICLWIPEGEGPFPGMLTVPVEWQVDFNCLWPQAAVKRGYMVCLYPGVSFTCRPAKGYESYKGALPAFRRDYPKATMADLPGNAWIAGRALDYLLDPKYANPVQKAQIGIIGHSRYGKQSLIAAALDERISSVVARSPGSPGSCPYRFTSRNTFAETSVDFPGDWFLKSLHRYYGRENELPIDAHGWLGLIAPRRCLIHTAHNDGCEPTFAVERAYREGSKVYRLLGRPESLRVSYRTGGHKPVTDEHRRQNFDWFDLSFGRGTAKQTDFPEAFIHRFDWPKWKSRLDREDFDASFSEPMAKPDPADRRARILWALGQKPEKIAWDGQYRFLTESESDMMTHDRWRASDTTRIPVSFGANVRGNIYYNPKIKTPAPAVIWLHPYSYHSGYNEGYGVQGTTVYHRLAQQGFVVMAFDQCGFGLRLLEGRDFYEAYPKWSRLGRMVHDVSAAVDFLIDDKGNAQGTMPAVDKRQIYVLGYSVGGMVGLYATALDERIAGLACFSGFTPMRTDTDAKPTGGIRQVWQWHALLPKLGLYHGKESTLPYDYEDVLALIAPRKCLVYAPMRDRFSDSEDIKACVAKAKAAWPDKDGLTFMSPDDICRFQKDQQDVVVKWLEGTWTK